MAIKNVLERYRSVDAADVSAQIISPVTSIKFLDNVLIELLFSGAPEGSFYVEVSNDYNPNTNTAGTWIPLDFQASDVLVSGAIDIMAEINQTPAPSMRVRWEPTLGSTGALTIWISAKEV